MVAQKSSQRDFAALEARRRQAIEWILKGQPKAVVARRLGVTWQAVWTWWRTYRRRGPQGLARRKHPGPAPKLPQRKLAQLPRLLAQGAEAHGFSSPLWTTQRVADLIWRRFRVRYDRDHVCRLLHRFGWSWQKPARRARERDEAAIQRWVQHTWPRIKKTRKR
jgi:transposase